MKWERGKAFGYCPERASFSHVAPACAKNSRDPLSHMLFCPTSASQCCHKLLLHRPD
ncbi:unnamed protein product [Haemonchus placei]|uniref:Uncharacterized protein n=1 Tax=Haemonchus placei TaxID=6290 RepID=A0A3P7XCT3_HAEPC|nr:unnamed protein product [Haemonchus placei]